MLNGNRTKSDRKRSPRDFYVTPESLVKSAILRFLDDEFDYPKDELPYCPVVLDPGCGTGVWGNTLQDLESIDPYIVGIDIEPKVEIRPGYPRSYATIIKGDYLSYPPSPTYDMVIGNPPYVLAEEFIRKSFGWLKEGGYIYFLLRLSFLEGISRGNGLFLEHPMKRAYVLSRRPSFFSAKDDGKHTTDTLAYAMFLWQKGWQGKIELCWLDWKY